MGNSLHGPEMPPVVKVYVAREIDLSFGVREVVSGFAVHGDGDEHLEYLPVFSRETVGAQRETIEYLTSKGYRPIHRNWEAEESPAGIRVVDVYSQQFERV